MALTTDMDSNRYVLMFVATSIAIPNTVLDVMPNTVYLVLDLNLGNTAQLCGAKGNSHHLCGYFLPFLPSYHKNASLWTKMVAVDHCISLMHATTKVEIFCPQT